MSSYTLNTDSGTSARLDFNLTAAEQEDYAQVTGDTVDFQLALTQNSVEVVALNDENRKTIGKKADEVFTLNEADIRKLNEVLNESAALNDSDSYSLRRTLNEQTSLNDVYSREAGFFRDYSESFSLNETVLFDFAVQLFETFVVNDADIRNVSKLLFEDFALNDVYNRTASYQRSYNEDIVLDDFVQAIKIRFIDVQEDLTLSTFAEFKAVLTLLEALAVNEKYSREASFFRNYSDVAGLNEDFSFSLQFSLDEETLALNTFAPLTLVYQVFESFSVDDTVTKTVSKLETESIGLNDDIRSFQLQKLLDERFVLNDSDIREMDKLLREAFSVNDVYSRTASYERSENEALGLDDDRTVSVSKVLDEQARLTGETVKTISKALNAGLDVREVFARESQYFRDYSDEAEIQDFKDPRIMVYRDFEEALVFDEFEKETFKRTLSESLEVFAELDYFFSEGPGTPPYYMRNSFVEKNTVNNQYVTKTIQNVFESIQINNSFGNKEQT